MKTLIPTALAAMAATFTSAIPLDVNSTDSIKNASATLAFGLLSWYSNNQSDTAPSAVGTLPQPLYWWEAGAMWAGVIDYWAYTNDTSYNPSVQQALLAQVGPDYNFMPPAYYSSLGNDDQAFWTFTALAALEYGFDAPEGQTTHDGKNVWLAVAENVFNSMVPRWNTSTCNGGIVWQIFPDNPNGYTYKNTVSNGGFFQIAARLARYTGNQTYVDWAERSFEWMLGVGLVDENNYNVFDGTDDSINCTRVDHTGWSYNPAILLYGSAIMYNYTGGAKRWENRVTGLMTSAAKTYFSPYKNSTNVMYQFACEPINTCNNDQFSFKAYLARWLAKSAIVAPYIAPEVRTLLTRSASAAAEACSGGVNGTECGTKWYVGGYDGTYGVGQQMSALETVQSLLLLDSDFAMPARYPATGPNVTISVQPSSSGTGTLSLPSPTTTTSGETPEAKNTNAAAVNRAFIFSSHRRNSNPEPGSGPSDWFAFFLSSAFLWNASGALFGTGLLALLGLDAAGFGDRHAGWLRLAGPCLAALFVLSSLPSVFALR